MSQAIIISLVPAFAFSVVCVLVIVLGLECRLRLRTQAALSVARDSLAAADAQTRVLQDSNAQLNAEVKSLTKEVGGLKNTLRIEANNTAYANKQLNKARQAVNNLTPTNKRLQRRVLELEGELLLLECPPASTPALSSCSTAPSTPPPSPPQSPLVGAYTRLSDKVKLVDEVDRKAAALTERKTTNRKTSMFQLLHL